MPVEIMLTVAVTAVVQSLFGAGVLLFGTPLLLLFGYEFVDVLVVLLPISITINALQIIQHRAQIDWAFYRKILLLTLPLVAVFLYLVTHARVNIGFVIGAFLLLLACKEFSPRIAAWINAAMRYETAYFLLMGAVHGSSNLGGSLLTALVHHKNYEKDAARVTVAASYATFAAVQILTLALFSKAQIDIPYADNAVYLVVGALVFVLADAVFYRQLGRERYAKLFAGFLALSGAVLILRSL